MAKIKAILLYNKGWMSEEQVVKSGAMKESDRRFQRVELKVQFKLLNKRDAHWPEQACPTWTRKRTEYIPAVSIVQQAVDHIAKISPDPASAKETLQQWIQKAAATGENPASVWPYMVLGTYRILATN